MKLASDFLPVNLKTVGQHFLSGCKNINDVIYFPEGFELECHLYRGGEAKLVKFNCAKLNVYYWDDDDHRCIDYYYYESEDDYKARYNDKWYSHICKDSDLTKESRAKVEEYLKNTPVPVRE